MEQVRSDLVEQGYSVFVDSEIMPTITPEEVTEDTAQSLRNALQDCTSLLYLISANSGTSRWMPWELGYFDGRWGRVFVYPCDEYAEKHAKGWEYLRIYPIVPVERDARVKFLSSNVPRSTTKKTIRNAGGDAKAILEALLEEVGARAPLFDHAQQEVTLVHGSKLTREMQGAIFDPTRAWGVMTELVQAWWRLWGLMPPPSRPGAEAGRWGAL